MSYCARQYIVIAKLRSFTCLQLLTLEEPIWYFFIWSSHLVILFLYCIQHINFSIGLQKTSFSSVISTEHHFGLKYISWEIIHICRFHLFDTKWFVFLIISSSFCTDLCPQNCPIPIHCNDISEDPLNFLKKAFYSLCCFTSAVLHLLSDSPQLILHIPTPSISTRSSVRISFGCLWALSDTSQS